MAIAVFLAMTAAEFRENPPISGAVAWMSALFSPFGRGVSNLPRQLPPGSLLILSDRTPMSGQEPEVIADQLRTCIDTFGCVGLLLDFQRPGHDPQAALAQFLVGALPCPVAVSAPYGQGLDCPVFLPPVPASTALKEYLAPWQGREIWLETAPEASVITVTQAGAEAAPLAGPVAGDGFFDPELHCHYRTQVGPDKAVFTLWRTRQDLDGLVQEAQHYGVTRAVGLWQELGVTIDN